MKQTGENETPFVRLEENSNWKEALHLRFYYYLDLLQTNKHPIRSTCTTQSSNASSVWNFCGAFLRKPSSDRDPRVVSWVGRKKKARDIFQARGSSAHARRRFCRAFSPDPVTTPGSLDVGRKPLIGKVIIEVATEQNITEIYSTYWKLSGCLENPAGFFLYVLWVALFFEETWT